MPLDSVHPQYSAVKPDWEKLRHCYAGERTIKEQGVIYLPATPGQILDGLNANDPGYQNYSAYKMRARFPNYVKRAVLHMVGSMNSKPPVIKLPKVMEPLLKSATTEGESLQLLLRRINAEQLITGRIGLLLDLPRIAESIALPTIATYTAETILNWDNGRREDPTLQTLNLVILDESENERDAAFEWQMVNKWRVLVLGDPTINETEGVYRQGLFRESTAFDASQLEAPSRAGRELDEIPFIFINATDLLSEPMPPPLLELADLSLTIYRGEADYRLNLFAQSQDTFVTIGAITSPLDPTPEWRLGAGAAVNIPGGPGHDAKMVGVSSTGLPEQRQALENDRTEARELASQLLDAVSREKESGEALKTRVAAQTVTLKEIAMTAAEGLQTALRMMARWIGVDPEQVEVQPNTEFIEAGLTAKDFLDVMMAIEKGLPLSQETVHERLVKNKWTEKEFAEEIKKVQEERQKKIEEMRAAMPPAAPGQPGARPPNRNNGGPAGGE